MAAARSFSSGVLSSVVSGLVSGAPAASEWAGALVSARAALRAAVAAPVAVAPAPFVLPASLACLPGVSFSAVVSVVSVSPVPGGVEVLGSDGVSRRCNWATVARFRGAASAAGAARFFADPAALVGRSFRFVAVGGWSSAQWFAAVVAC